MSTAGVSRRTFLAGSAAGLGLLAVGVPPAGAVPPGSRPLFAGPFPRTFAFRQSEVLAQFHPYVEWAELFAPFGGIMGKVLPEERTDTVTARNVPYFNRFKRDHPDAVVVLHYNGRGRLPLYRAGSWYAGDWLHFAGATVTSAVGTGDTVLSVDDASGFSAPTDPYGTVGADLVLTGRTAGGRPNWSLAEQLVVTAVDQVNRTLTVRRGQYGSAALALAPGGYIARHVTLGPWSAQDGRLWAYNLATDAPRGPDGLGAAERICAEMGADFGPGGQLARFDGVEFDIFVFPVLMPGRNDVDGNGDGDPDGCFTGGADTYLAGQADFLARLRAVLGAHRFIATDGAIGQRPDAAVTNGIEEEGFAADGATTLEDWSKYLGALAFWESVGHPTRFSYPLVKTGTGVGDAPDFPGVRISIAAALLTGCQVSFWDEPAGTSLDGLRQPPDSGNFVDRFSVWDELINGAAADPGWLGRPTGPAVWTATAGPDLLAGAGVHLPAAWVAELVLSRATATRMTPPAVRLDPTGAGDFTAACTVPGFAGGDLVVTAGLRTEVTSGLPAGVPRWVTVTIRSGTTRAVSKHNVATAYHPIRAYARDLPPGDVHVQFAFPAGPAALFRAIRAYAAPDAGYRIFDNGAVFANPSRHPHTFHVAPLGDFVRLTATSGQDATVNDGSPVGATLTVPPCDALLVRRAG